MGGSKDIDPVIVGWWYYMDVHLVLCHGPIDALVEVKVGGRTLKLGAAEITANETVEVNQQYLFGGDKREGGLMGNMDVMLGGATQPVNPWMSKSIVDATGADPDKIPAFRGLASLFFRGFQLSASGGGGSWTNTNPVSTAVFSVMNAMRTSFMWAANNPYFKPVMAKVRRLPQNSAGITGGAPTYITVAGVKQANPAYMIAEVLTNQTYVGGVDPDGIDNDTFAAASLTLESEGLGLGMSWKATTTRRAFLRRVLDHINGVLGIDVNTGKFTLTLIRDDSVLEDLTLLDETNCSVTEMSRRGLSDTVNEVVVTYVRPDTGEPDTVTAQNVANFEKQGRVVTHEQEYEGVHSQELAQTLAHRDLATLSKPLSKISLKTNRIGRGLSPGTTFKLSYPALGITEMVLRVVQRDLGGLDSGEILIDAIEDVFSTPDIDTSDIVDSEWVPPENPPVETTDYLGLEMFYAAVLRSTLEGERDYFTSDPCFGAVLAEPPTSDSTAFALYDTDTETKAVDGVYTTVATLGEDVPIGKDSVTVDLSTVNEVFTMASGSIVIGLVNDELVQITDFDIEALTATFERAVYDTVPEAHTTGDKLYILHYAPFELNFDKTERATGETANYKILTETTLGYLEPVDATGFGVTMQGRYSRPYPPADLTVNAADYPTYIAGELVLGWNHRDRLAQEDVPVLQTDASVGPEASTTYEIDIYDRDDVLLRSITGETGTTYTYSDEVADAGDIQGQLRVVIRSERDTLKSLYEHDFTFDRAGYGLNYGLYYGGGT